MLHQGWRFILVIFISALSLPHLLAQHSEKQARLQSGLLAVPLQPSIDDLTPEKWVQRQFAKGYLFAGYDSLYRVNDSVFYALQPGQRHKIKNITAITPFDTLQVASLFGLLHDYSKQGFPFCVFTPIDLVQHKKGFEIIGSLDIGPSITFDSIQLAQPIDINYPTLSRLLKIKYGQPYNQRTVNLIPTRVSASGNLTLNAPLDLSFGQGKAKVYVDLASESYNQFDGIIGFQSDPVTNRTVLTGLLDISLNNLFKSNRSFAIKWQRFDVSSQLLDVSYSHPYIFSSPIRLETDFFLLRQDTSFIQTRLHVFTDVELAAGHQIGLSYGLESSNILDAGLALGADFQTVWYGFRMYNSQVNSPAKYKRSNLFHYYQSISLGKKAITSDSAFSTRNLRLDGSLIFQRTYARRSSVFLSNQFGYLDNAALSINEFYRIGGLRTLRGYNEQQFFASGFVLQSIEFRLFQSNSAFFSVFTDHAILNHSLRESTEYVSSLGIGAQFPVSAGQFHFNFASPFIQQNKPRQAQIMVHFGYEARF